MISRWQAFHGNNVAVAGFSGLTARRKIFQPMYVDSPHIPPAFCYRCPFEQTYPECNLLCARALETAIRQQGPENVAAFIAEPVVGAALGCVPAPDGYFQKIREICDRYDVLFIADEVMTGWGRTGKMWGIEHWGVTPDIIATAKGMTAGYTPLSAIIARDDIWQALERNHSAFKAGHTLNANAVSCAGAIAVINYSLSHDLAGNAAARGEQALAGLTDLMAKHPIIGDVRGRGLMFGFELVADRATRSPFPPAREGEQPDRSGGAPARPGDLPLHRHDRGRSRRHDAAGPAAGHHRAGDGRGAGHPRSGGGRGRRDARGALSLRSIMLALRPHLKSGEP